MTINPVAGGMFLAFPAILPATLTLIEKKEGPDQVRLDAEGAVLGALALSLFAVVAGAGLRRTGAPLSLAAAAVAWMGAAVTAYLVVEKLVRRYQRSKSADEAKRGAAG